MLLLLLACAPTDPGTPASTPELPPAMRQHSEARQAAWSALLDELRAELGEGYHQDVPGLSEADARAGRALFATHCAPCHGEGGGGEGPRADAPLPDLAQPGLVRAFSSAGLLHLVSRGWPEQDMPPFGAEHGGPLSSEQLLRIVAATQQLAPSGPELESPPGEQRASPERAGRGPGAQRVPSRGHDAEGSPEATEDPAPSR